MATSAFAALKKATATKAQPALRLVPLQPNAFSSNWAERPRAPVEIGLCLISEADVATARCEAAKLAWELHREDADEANRIDAFNDAIMRWLVARGTCQPGNSAEPYFRRDEDSVRKELNSGGVLALYEAIERLAVEESPLTPGATDEQIDQLAKLLKTGDAWAGRDLTTVKRARRLLAFVLVDVLGHAAE